MFQSRRNPIFPTNGLKLFTGVQVFTSALVMMLALSGCGALLAPNAVYGSGNLQSEERQVANFTGVSLTNLGSVTIEQGDKAALTVSADDNILPLLTSTVENGVLELGVKPLTVPVNATIKFKVTVESLDQIDLSGAGEIIVNPLQSDAIKASVSGLGSLEFEALEAQKLDVSVSGAGKLTGKGNVEQLTIDLSGTGSCDVEKLVSQRATVSMSGAGSVVVNASEALDVDLSGLGSVEYVGNPKVTQEVSGVGSISKK